MNKRTLNLYFLVRKLRHNIIYCKLSKETHSLSRSLRFLIIFLFPKKEYSRLSSIIRLCLHVQCFYVDDNFNFSVLTYLKLVFCVFTELFKCDALGLCVVYTRWLSSNCMSDLELLQLQIWGGRNLGIQKIRFDKKKQWVNKLRVDCERVVYNWGLIVKECYLFLIRLALRFLALSSLELKDELVIEARCQSLKIS